MRNLCALERLFNEEEIFESCLIVCLILNFVSCSLSVLWYSVFFFFFWASGDENFSFYPVHLL